MGMMVRADRDWRVLVVGGGAREHALCWKLRQSSRVGPLYCAPGNPGTSPIAKNLPIPASAIDRIIAAVEELAIDLVVVGPEEPLARGLADRLAAQEHPVFGPSQAAAQLEASKIWTKQLLCRLGVPTARAETFDDAGQAKEYAAEQTMPIVVKADGLAAGKGVTIARTFAEAAAAIDGFIVGQTVGSAGSRVVIEEFLSGDEVSVFGLVCDTDVVLLPPACDHKAVGDGDHGPNTGGMGAYAPTQILDSSMLAAIQTTVFDPVVQALAEAGTPYRGVLYAGLMLTTSGPQVLEFNCRFGDPEAQVLLPMLDVDLAEIMMAVATGQAIARTGLSIHPRACCGVVLAAAGYPGQPRVGDLIHGLPGIDSNALVFQGGTAQNAEGLVTNGGRVMTVVGTGPDLKVACDHCYRNVERISFVGAHFRHDIGQRDLVRL